jgi:hypothetical protein
MTSSYSDKDYAKMDKPERVAACLERIDAYNSYYSPNIVNARFTRNFVYVDQWSPDERRARWNRATITVNNIISMQRALLAEQREADPQLGVFAVNLQIPQKQINITQDRLRYDAFRSNTKMVYQTAYKDALDCGFGAFYIDIDYESPKTFKKIITFNAVKDVLMCFWDPAANHPNKTDGSYSGFVFTMAEEEFLRRWPDADPSQAKSPPSSMESNLNYNQDDNICYVIKKWYKEYFNQTIYLTEDGQEYTKDEYKEYAKQQKMYRRKLLKFRHVMTSQEYEHIIERTEVSPIADKRTSTDFKIKCALLTNTEELEVNDFPGKKLPLIYVEGFSSYVNGRQVTHPFAQAAVDSQRLMNYAASSLAEGLMKSRKEQWLVTPKMIEGQEQLWSDTTNIQGALQYNPDAAAHGAGGMPVPAQVATPINPQFQQIYQQTQQDVRTTTGRYLENAGQSSGRESTETTLAKQASGNLTVGVYPDNLMDAIAEGGRVWAGIAPEIYDTDRELILMGEGGQTRHERVNYKSDVPKHNSFTNEDEYDSINNITVGEYDVQVYAGQSFAAQNAINLQQMNQMFEAAQSPVFSLFADIYMKSLNTPNKNEMAKRAKMMMVPPQIVAMDEGKPPPPPPPPSTQEKIEMAGLAVKAEQIKADATKAEATKIGALSEAFQKILEVKATQSSSNAEEIKAVSDAVIAITNAGSTSTKAMTETVSGVLKVESELLKRENESMRTGKDS